MKQPPASLVAAFLLSMGHWATAGVADSTSAKAVEEIPPDVAYQTLVDNTLSGQWHLVWDQLPEAQQEDISDCIRIFAEKMDPDVWHAMIRLGDNVQRIVKDKKHDILAWRRDNTDDAVLEEPLSTWHSVVAIISLTLDELRDLEKLKDPDVRGFLSGRGQKIREHLETLAAVAPEEGRESLQKDFRHFLKEKMSLMQSIDDKARILLIESNGDRAKIQMEMTGGGAEVIEMVKTEGKWLPADTICRLKDAVTKAKRNAETFPHPIPAKRKHLILGMARKIDSMLDQVLATEREEDFNEHFTYAVFRLFLFLGCVFSSEDSFSSEDVGSFHEYVVADAALLQVKVPRLLRNGVTHLSITNATDESLKHILPLRQQLVALDLAGDTPGWLFGFDGDSSPEVSNLSPLIEFRKLRELRLPTVSEIDIDALRKKLPKCEIK